MLKRLPRQLANRDKTPKHNSPKRIGLINLDSFVIDERHNTSDFLPIDESFDTLTKPATEIKPKSATTYDQTIVFFARLSRQVSNDETPTARLPGLAKTTLWLNTYGN